MKDLYRCLDASPPELLAVIAQAWDASYEAEASHQAARNIAAAMLSPERLQAMLESLSREALNALYDLAASGGALPSWRLSLCYGPLRRLGPARLSRDKAWQNPANALEELYFVGLLYRTYGQIDDYYGEVLLIPDQILEILPNRLLESPPWEDTLLHHEPAHIIDSRDTLQDDILALLVALRKSPHSFQPSPRSLISLLKRLDRNGRLLGSNSSERLQFLSKLLLRSGLVQNAGGKALLTLRARDWLRASPASQRTALFEAWRDTDSWYPSAALANIPDVNRPGPGPALARRHLLTLLSQLPEERWLSLASVIRMIKRQNPEFLRPFDPNERIKDPQSGNWLQPAEIWDRVEGQFIRHVLTGPLAWLGLVRLGTESDNDQEPFALALKPGATRILTGENSHKAAIGHLSKPLARVLEDGSVIVPVHHTSYERYQLERFAEWRKQNSEATYLLTNRSIRSGRWAGIKDGQMISFLRRITGDHLPASVGEHIREWWGSVGEIALNETILLRTDPATLQELVSAPQLSELLGPQVDATSCLVSKENLPILLNALKRLGIKFEREKPHEP